MMEQKSIVINSLRLAVAALKNQDQQTAIKTLDVITNDVKLFKSRAEGLEKKMAQKQTTKNREINDLLREQGRIHKDWENEKGKLDRLYSEITSKKVSIHDLERRINREKAELKRLEAQLRYCQARINDLNDKSVESIFLSIFCLGLDRAVKAISIEVDGVKRNISNIRSTIQAYNKDLENLKKQQERDEMEVKRCNNDVNKKEQDIKLLSFKETQLHSEEETLRNQLIAITKIHMFYIKLQNVLENCSHKIEDVRDIVEELDSQAPTLVSFDPLQRDLISLSQAIALFEDSAKENKSLEAVETFIDENNRYYLSSEWIGKDKSLVVSNEGANYKLFIGDNKPGSGWIIKSAGNGYFWLSYSYPDGDKSLEVSRDGNYFLILEHKNVPEQLWKIEPEFGSFRILNEYLGDMKSLSVSNDKTSLMMSDTANLSSQKWVLRW